MQFQRLSRNIKRKTKRGQKRNDFEGFFIPVVLGEVASCPSNH